jgi:alkanesulfonate monooxygenase SsuD/methylene tetrahydromethanopterin reductase-like flavin-dependent oxidoreductase (luciferase family)
MAPSALRRVGRLADGWFPMVRPGAGLDEALAVIAEGAAEVGRDLTQIPFEGRVDYAAGDPEKMSRQAERWRSAGATHLSVNTMASGLIGVEQHLRALGELAEALL